MKILLVSPVFHGYWRAVSAALESLGHDVTVHRYDATDPQVRAANIAAHRVPGSRATRGANRLMTRRAIAALRREPVDAVLVVKGDALGDEWWEALSASGARNAVWLYDELERMRYDDAVLREADAVFSYSAQDVAALRERSVGAAHLPDGFDAFTPFTSSPSTSVSFIGARYPERERLMRTLDTRGVPVAVYGREWSRHPWDIVRTRRWGSSGLPARGDVSRSRYYGIMAGSVATMNIHGNGHDGLSMRTFEAPGVGGLQLIDRADVAQHYDVGTEVLVYSSDDELVAHIERARREPRWADKVRVAGRRRTLAEHTIAHRMRQVVDRWG